jgi:rRNA pseudouridine-1189 N-methylase Emg1 (Nep1/Mra1 family)
MNKEKYIEETENYKKVVEYLYEKGKLTKSNYEMVLENIKKDLEKFLNTKK